MTTDTEKESFEPGTKEFLIREILSRIPVAVADATDPALDDLAALVMQGFQYLGFFSDLLAASEAQGRPFSHELLASIIKDTLSKHPSGTAEQARDVILSTGISPEALAEIVRDVRPAIHHPNFLPNLRRQLIDYGTDEAKADNLAQAFCTLVRAAG